MDGVSDALPPFTIAVRERNYPRDRLVLRVSRLRFVRSFTPTVRSLYTRVYIPRPLLYQPSYGPN